MYFIIDKISTRTIQQYTYYTPYSFRVIMCDVNNYLFPLRYDNENAYRQVFDDRHSFFAKTPNYQLSYHPFWDGSFFIQYYFHKYTTLKNT